LCHHKHILYLSETLPQCRSTVDTDLEMEMGALGRTTN